MIAMPGKNDFKGVFSSLEWSAPIYETPSEILNAYKSFDIATKRIVDIHAIGGVFWPTLSSRRYAYLAKLRDAGMSEASVSRLKHVKSFNVERSADLVEPVVFTFEDGSTFEFCAYSSGVVRMSVNTIPAHIEDGLNHSNINLRKIVPRDFIGSTLGEMTIKKEKELLCESDMKRSRENHWERDTDSCCRWESEDYSCHIKFGRYVSYELFVTGRYKSKPEEIDVTKKRKARKKINQLLLSRGGESASFAISTFCKNYDVLNAVDKFIVNTTNLYVYENLLHLLFDFDLLDRYFDKSINRRYGDDEGFYDYGSNYYSFDYLKRMIARMRDKNAELLASCDNPWIKNDFDHLTFTHDWYRKANPAEDEEILTPYYANLICDFRERFYKYLEDIMKVSTNIKGICFTGP